MSNNNEPIVLFVTQNHKLFTLLDKAMTENIVLKAEGLQVVHKAVKGNSPVGAVVLHVTHANNWIIFELIKTSYPDLPRFAVLSPKTENEGFEDEVMATRYGAAAIVTEAQVKDKLAPLICQVMRDQPPSEVDSKGVFLTTFGDVHRELTRINKEFFTIGMRTLPQNQIGEDTNERLSEVLSKLKRIKIRA